MPGLRICCGMVTTPVRDVKDIIVAFFLVHGGHDFVELKDN